GIAPFAGPVVQDGHTRSERGEGRGSSGVQTAVVRNEIDIDCTDEIGRTGQREKRWARQIADIEEAKLSELQPEPGRARILVRLLRCHRRGALARWLSCARK